MFPMFRTAPRLRSALVVALAALALSACGRRGPLETPSNAPKEEAGKTTTINESVPSEDSFASTNVIGKPAKANRAIVIPKRDFILDPLL